MRIYWITKLSDNNPFRSTQLGASDGLRKRGHEVKLFFIRDFTEKKTNSKEIQYIPTIDKTLLSGLVFGLLLLFYFPFQTKKNKVNVVIIDGDQIFSPFVLIFKLLRIPIIWDIRSLPIDKDRSILHDISFHLTKLFATALTTITPELRKILQNNYHLHDKKIGIWSSGVSLETFKKHTQPHIPDNNSFIIIHHGTYSPTRGIEELIQSIKELDESIRKNIKLRLIGIPKEKIQELTRLSETLQIKPHVEIIPPVDLEKIPAYIQSADIGVIPLPPENKWWKVSVPLKTLEYLAMGKPIIVTDIPFHKKIFNECPCGVIIQSEKPQEISKAISYLYGHKNELENIGEMGRKLIETSYTWDAKAQEIEHFIEEILENKI